MRLKSRLKKLEKSLAPKQELPVVITRIAGRVPGKPLAQNLLRASIPGTSVGRIFRADTETDEQFRERVDAIKVLGREIAPGEDLDALFQEH